jgi:hypothetical protein
MGGTYLLDPMTSGAMAPVSVMWDGHDVKDSGFDGTLGRDFDDVVVTLTNRFAEVSGVVRDGSTPAPGVVLVFPVDRDRWTNYGWMPLRLRSASAASSGVYRVQRLSEGEYFLIAVDSAKSTAWMDPRFLAAAATHAARLSVKWGEKVTFDLKIESVVVK